MGRLTQSTEEIQSILDSVQDKADKADVVQPDWDATRGKAAVKNRPFGFNNPIRLSDADEITRELINADYDKYRITYKFSGYTFEYGLFMFARLWEYDPTWSFKNVSYKRIYSGDDFVVGGSDDSGDMLHIEVVYDDYTDESYETIITLQGENLYEHTQAFFEENVILADSMEGLRSALPDIFIPDSIARQESVLDLYEEASLLWDETSSLWEETVSLNGEVSEIKGRVEELENGDGFDAKGIYPDLIAGDLAGHGESVPAEFSFRASGGKSIKDGRAYIKRIKGNSVVWNQQVDTITPQDCELSETDNRLTLTPQGGFPGVKNVESMNIIENHIYICISHRIGGGFLNVNCGGYDSDTNIPFSAKKRDYGFTVYYYGETQTVTITRPILIDLTQMFGAGNEPATIEEFYSLVPSGIDLFAYNEGEVIHCNTESIESVGDNALDVDRSLVFDFDGSYGNYNFINTEDAFVGISADGYINNWAIDYAEKIEGGFRLHSNAGGYGIGLFVKALPNEEYSVSYASDNGRIAFGFYDKGKNFISYEMWENRITTPSNCEYIMLCLRDNEVVNIDISFTDIMLTLVHSGWKQDTDAGYQEYWQDSLPLPIIRKYFPQGMKKAGTAHDEIRYNKASGKWEYSKGKIKSVDLGDFTWETPWYNDNDGWRIYAQLQGKRFGLSNILNKRYANAGVADGAMSDKSITGNDNLDYIYIKDSSFSAEGVDALIASLQGVMLYYESNDWEWVELDAEDQNFRDYYKVADFGTEQAISSVPSAPFSADIIYQFNAVDMIREHELEITQLQQMIATMQAQLISITNK